jgi:regulation of enolase protein 1 (concanavalin A-like superfamily)
VPAPWSSSDIGAVGKSGSATFEAATGTFSVTGAGADVGGTTDAFHFVYRRLTGNVDVVAHVRSVERTDPWAKAGVMIRQTLDPRSAHVSAFVSAQKGVVFQRRTRSASKTAQSTGPAVAAPYWLKLQRRGVAVIAWTSSDGRVWKLLGVSTIPTSGEVYVGLAVTSHTTAAAASAVFSDVAVP